MDPISGDRILGHMDPQVVDQIADQIMRIDKRVLLHLITSGKLLILDGNRNFMNSLGIYMSCLLIYKHKYLTPHQFKVTAKRGGVPRNKENALNIWGTIGTFICFQKLRTAFVFDLLPREKLSG